MNIFLKLTIAVFMLNLSLDKVNCNDKVDKLKIGIKKRVRYFRHNFHFTSKFLILQWLIIFQVEDCTQKSRKGDLLHIDYTGTLQDGTVFDSSIGKKPLTFTLGAGQVIKGWDRGVLGMCVGEIRKLQIPPELGYGSSAVGKIPKNSVLIFEVELIKIERKDEF
jgi:FK506-binding protein 2